MYPVEEGHREVVCGLLANVGVDVGEGALGGAGYQLEEQTAPGLAGADGHRVGVGQSDLV